MEWSRERTEEGGRREDCSKATAAAAVAYEADELPPSSPPEVGHVLSDFRSTAPRVTFDRLVARKRALQSHRHSAAGRRPLGACQLMGGAM